MSELQKYTGSELEISREVLLTQLSVARMTLAYIRDKAESHTVTRSHLKDIADRGIKKSGGPITLADMDRRMAEEILERNQR